MPTHIEQEQFYQISLDLVSAIETEDLEEFQEILDELSPVDIAHLIESSPDKRRKELWQHLGDDLQGDVINHLGDDLQNYFLSRMSTKQILETAQDLESDDVADMLQLLPEKNRNRVLFSMEPEDRREVEELLAYHEDTAGGLMNPEVITVRAGVTLDVVLRYLRRQQDLPDRFESVFVVNRSDKLVGILHLSDLITQEPETTVREIMDSDVEGIPAEMPDTEVALLFQRHDYLSAPVVDHTGKLLGRITVDDVVDVIREEVDHTVMSLAGLDEDADTFATVAKSVRSRAIWLGLNLITAFVAALVILEFEDAIAVITALAVLNPVVASMGGVAGSQTLTLVIRALAMGQLNSSNFYWFLARELGVGVINGLLWAVVTGGVAYLLFQNWQLSLVSGAAILLNITVAKCTGAILPMVLKTMKIDPALSGSVILTTVTDAVGFFTLLGLATWYML